MNTLTLAAGLGSRLTPDLETPIPKALLTVGSETLLERQARQLSSHNRHTAVIGRQGDCWTEEFIDQFEESVDETIVNKYNAETEAGYSFLLGLQAMPTGSDILVIDGDIILEDELLNAICSHRSNNIALVRAVETKSGVNRGACVDFDGTQITRCGFDISSSYVYSGVMRLSASAVEYLKNKDPELFKQEQLATLIDQIAREKELTGYTVNSEVLSIPVIEEPLDGYEGAGKTSLNRRKEKITKQAKSSPGKLRDEIERSLSGFSSHPTHFPDISDISFFDQEPSYEMPDYSKRGYQPFDEMIRSKRPASTLADLSKPPIKFILNDFGSSNPPIPGLYKNSFLPKIRTRYEPINESTPLIGPASEKKTVTINQEEVPGLPVVESVLKKDAEFLGRLEPEQMSEIHGDFKPDNILINMSDRNFILIDPRGRSEIGTVTHDPLYDLAKFLTSTYGYYTSLKYGDFEISIEKEYPSEIRYRITDYLSKCEEITETAIDCAKNAIDGFDADSRIRLQALTGLLLIANAPVHTSRKGPNEMPVVEFARGLELFHKAYQDFSSKVDQKGTVININTMRDLDLACQTFDDEIKNYD